MKYHGNIGFVKTEETSPGVWEEVVTEREHFGDVLQKSVRWQGSSQVNEDISIKNQISIVAKPYTLENMGFIRYVEWMNSKWKVTGIDAANYPRLILDIGGVYNG